MSMQGQGTGGDIYGQSANALMGAGNIYATPGLTGGAGRFQYDPTGMDPSTYRAAQMTNPDQIAAGIQDYMNPYTSSVIDSAMSDMSRLTRMQQDQNAASAVNAGAFGGSRHGLVEAQTNSEAQRNLGALSGNLHHQGFTTAAGLAAQDVANQMGADQYNATAKNAARQFNTGNRQQANLMDMTAANQAEQFNGQMGYNWANAKAGDSLARAGGLAGLGQLGVNIGDGITGQQQAQGSMMQQLIQAVMSGSQGQYGQFMNQPANMLDMALSAAGMSPLNNATTTTGQYNPGLMDYLGLGVQGLGAWRMGA